MMSKAAVKYKRIIIEWSPLSAAKSRSWVALRSTALKADFKQCLNKHSCYFKRKYEMTFSKTFNTNGSSCVRMEMGMMSQVQEEEFMCSLYNGIKLDKRGRIIMMSGWIRDLIFSTSPRKRPRHLPESSASSRGEEVEALSIIDWITPESTWWLRLFLEIMSEKWETSDWQASPYAEALDCHLLLMSIGFFFFFLNTVVEKKWPFKNTRVCVDTALAAEKGPQETQVL